MNCEEYLARAPSIRPIARQEEAVWINPRLVPYDVTKGVSELVVSDADIADAAARLKRFAAFFRRAFPETAETNGIIESPLRLLPHLQKKLTETYGAKIPGKLYLKMDSHLAVAGSIKARGGIYEVLKHAETLAIDAGLITPDNDYGKFAEMKEFFSKYMVQVGSTGNLALSIGIVSAALGFRVRVHISADAKQWKKDLLRAKGVEVIEYDDDFARAVLEGRRASEADSMSYFVDDERSRDLFMGYTVAGARLQKQLEEMNIPVDADHPLIVYIPAGIGGSPGGVSYGLRRIYGDDVHAFFVEPATCPSVLLGMATQAFEGVNVHDFGISGRTEADGLAVPCPSGFVTRLMTNQVAGIFTAIDAKLYDYLRLLDASEGVRIEPSSCAAFVGPLNLLRLPDAAAYCKAHDLTPARLANATQIAWATGGGFVPEEMWTEYLATYQ